jgi:hypothetical protein
LGFSFYFKVVNLFSAMSGTGISGINPMLLPMLLSDEEEDESMLLPMLMCGGMGALTGDVAGNTGIMGQGMNHMMMAMIQFMMMAIMMITDMTGIQTMLMV